MSYYVFFYHSANADDFLVGSDSYITIDGRFSIAHVKEIIRTDKDRTKFPIIQGAKYYRIAKGGSFSTAVHLTDFIKL